MGRELGSKPLAVLLLAACLGGLGMEADQYTVPTRPLTDIGPEVSELIWVHIRRAVADLNAGIADAVYKAEISTTPAGREHWLRKERQFRSPDALANAVFQSLGKGFPEAQVEILTRQLAANVSNQPATHFVEFDRSIFQGTGFARPLNHFAMVPTILVHDVHVSTDKLGHFMQQGFEYYREYRRALRSGRSQSDAIRGAIENGKGQERGIYGYIPTGVYSNADLASNYAGFRFYLNLTYPINVNGGELPPLFIMTESGWQVHEDSADRIGPALLRPFVTDHWNEVLNPAAYEWGIHESIATEIAKRQAEWTAFYDIHPNSERARLRSMALWYGEDYGHSGPENVITALNLPET